MGVAFHQLIDRNKRNSWLLIVAFTLVVVGLAATIGYAWGGQSAMGLAHALTMGSIALAFSLTSALASYFGGASAILAMSRAKPIEKKDDPQLYNVVEEMAIAAGLPVPKVYLIDDTAPNAFATGRNPEHGVIAITTGLRNKLNRDELQGVIAHEMGHIRNLDIRFAVLMATLVGVVVLLCDMFLRSLHWGRYARFSRSRGSKRGGGGAIVIVMLLAVILSIIAPIIARILEMAFSRQREYLADATAVELTRNPQGLIGALAKISSDPDVLEVANRATAPMYIVHPIKHFEDRASTIMDSHPPIKDRIARLQSLMT